MSKEGKELVSLFIVALGLYMGTRDPWLIVSVCTALVFLKVGDNGR